MDLCAVKGLNIHPFAGRVIASVNAAVVIVAVCWVLYPAPQPWEPIVWQVASMAGVSSLRILRLSVPLRPPLDTFARAMLTMCVLCCAVLPLATLLSDDHTRPFSIESRDALAFAIGWLLVELLASMGAFVRWACVCYGSDALLLCDPCGVSSQQCPLCYTSLYKRNKLGLVTELQCYGTRVHHECYIVHVEDRTRCVACRGPNHD